MSIWSKKQEREKKNRTYMKTESEKQQENKELEKTGHQKIGNLFFFKTEK